MGAGCRFILGDPSVNLEMFVRKKLNKSGVISVQIIEKRSGKSTLVKTLGSSADSKQIAGLVENGKQFINKIKGQSSFHFDLYEEQQLVDLFFNGIRALSLAGPNYCSVNSLMKLGLMQSKTKCSVIWF